MQQLTSEDRRVVDERLAERTAAGDERAFAELYDRYFQEVYDFTLRLVRDREAAADIVQATFVNAWEALRDGRVTTVKAWLYAVAHNGAMDELRRRSRLASGEDAEALVYAQVDPSRFANPEAVAGDRELVELVWSSAAALNPQEYGLLDLHLRQGFEAPELADALGLERGAVYTRLSRLRDSLEEAVTTTLLMRRGRRECGDLDALLAEHGATSPTREARALVARHLDECATCSEQKERITSPSAILAGLALIPAPLALKDSIWVGVSGSTFGRPEGSSASGGAATGAGVGVAAGAAAGHAALGLKAAVATGVVLAVGAAGLTGILLTRGGSDERGRGGGAAVGVVAVEDPADVHSTSHGVGDATAAGEIVVVWTPRSDASGYSVEWSEGASALPDAVVDLPASAGSAERRVGPGAWWFNLRTRDENGLWTSTVHLGPLLVTGPPDTSIEGGPSGVVGVASASFQLASDQSDAAFECSLDGGKFKACDSPAEVSGLGPGRHRFRARARNAAGQADPTPAQRVWVVDVEPPAAQITEAATPATALQATFRFGASEAGASFECRLDGGAYVSCASPAFYGGLAQGRHSFAVRATDRTGNIGNPASHTWRVDTVPPETTIVSGPSGSVGTNEATFQFAASERGSILSCRLDDGPFQPCSSPRTYRGLGLGSHTFQVVARDAAGNQDPSRASRSWRVVDRRAPQTAITSGPSGLIASAEASFGFASSESGSTFVCRLDGGAWRSCSSPQTYKLDQGGHTFAVRATDGAGNTDPSPATRAFTVDTVAPDTKLVTVPPQGDTGEKGSTFEFASDDKNATFECSLDGAEFAACKSPATYLGLKAGSHVFRVRAVDAAGNRDSTPAEHKWDIRGP